MISKASWKRSRFDFEASLRPQLQRLHDEGKLGRHGLRVLNLLSSEPRTEVGRKLKEKRIDRLHDRTVKWIDKEGTKVANAAGQQVWSYRDGAIQWDNFPWKEVLSAFLSFVAVILPLIFKGKS